MINIWEKDPKCKISERNHSRGVISDRAGHEKALCSQMGEPPAVMELLCENIIEGLGGWWL